MQHTTCPVITDRPPSARRSTPARSRPTVVARFVRTKRRAGSRSRCCRGRVVWAKSPWQHSYETLWHSHVTIGVGVFRVDEASPPSAAGWTDLAAARSTITTWEHEHQHAGDLAGLVAKAERETRARLYRTLDLVLNLDPVGDPPTVDVRLQLCGGRGGIEPTTGL